MFVINLTKKRMQCLNTYCDFISEPLIEEFCGYPNASNGQHFCNPVNLIH